jgi:hypothetical protein
MTDPSGFSWLSDAKDDLNDVGDSLGEAYRVYEKFTLNYYTDRLAIKGYMKYHDWARKNIPGVKEADGLIMDSEISQTAFVMAATYFGGPQGGVAAQMHLAYLHGGSADDIRQVGQRAAVTAAVSQAFHSYIKANFGDGAGVRVASGGVGGFAQTGTTRGLLGGMAGGLIPNDAGMSDVYTSGEVANPLINIGVAAVRGYLVDGEDGAIQGVKASLVADILGHAGGRIASKGSGPIDFKDGAYIYEAQWGFDNGTGITLGNVIIGPSSSLTESWFMSHEFGHFNNQRSLGASYLPMHGLSIASGWLTDQAFNTTPRNNPHYFMEQGEMKTYPYSSR